MLLIPEPPGSSGSNSGSKPVWKGPERKGNKRGAGPITWMDSPQLSFSHCRQAEKTLHIHTARAGTLPCKVQARHHYNVSKGAGLKHCHSCYDIIVILQTG